MEVSFAHDGVHGLERALAGGFDLIVLDLMLPGLDGFQLLKRLRAQSNVLVRDVDGEGRGRGPHCRA